MIDTLMYVKKLEAVGIPREQAELQVEIMADIVDNNYATKGDIKDVRQEIKDVRQEIKDLEVRVTHQFARLEDRLTIKMGGMLAVAVGLIVTLQKIL